MERMKKDSVFKLKVLIRYRIRKKVKKNNNTTSNILGCSYKKFHKYLESKFEPWMNWENHGLFNNEENYGWDLDHIIPIASAKTEEDLLKLNHYSNFQPLCSYINRVVKRDKHV